MPSPWRIAEQVVTLMKDDEPGLTLMFMLDHHAADKVMLRIVPPDHKSDAIELSFATGGMMEGQMVLQPRWLRPGERLDPNLHLDDNEKWEEHVKQLDDVSAARLTSQREALLKRRESYYDIGDAAEGPVDEAPPAKVQAKG